MLDHHVKSLLASFEVSLSSLDLRGNGRLQVAIDHEHLMKLPENNEWKSFKILPRGFCVVLRFDSGNMPKLSGLHVNAATSISTEEIAYDSYSGLLTNKNFPIIETRKQPSVSINVEDNENFNSAEEESNSTDYEGEIDEEEDQENATENGTTTAPSKLYKLWDAKDLHLKEFPGYTTVPRLSTPMNSFTKTAQPQPEKYSVQYNYTFSEERVHQLIQELNSNFIAVPSIDVSSKNELPTSEDSSMLTGSSLALAHHGISNFKNES